MIARHLEELYPNYNIEFVVIQAEDAYDARLVSRLRAYDAVTSLSTSLAPSTSVTVDLTRPGKTSLVHRQLPFETHVYLQSFPSHLRPTIPSPL